MSSSGALSSSQDSSLSQTGDYKGVEASVLKVESVTADKDANLNSGTVSLSSGSISNNQLSSASENTAAEGAVALTSGGSGLDSTSASSFSSSQSVSSSGALSSSQDSTLSQTGDYKGAGASVLNVESITVDKNANLNSESAQGLSSSSNLNSQFASAGSNTDAGTAEALTRSYTGNPFLGGRLHSASSSSSSSESASSSAAMSSSQDSSVSQSLLSQNAHNGDNNGAPVSVLKVESVTVEKNTNLNDGSAQGLTSSSNLDSQFASAGSNTDVGTAAALTSIGSRSYTGNPFFGGRLDSVSSSSSSSSSDSTSNSAMSSSQDSSVSQSYLTGSNIGGAHTSVLNTVTSVNDAGSSGLVSSANSNNQFAVDNANQNFQDHASALAQQSGSQVLGAGAIANEGYNQNQGSNENKGLDSSNGRIMYYAQSGPVVHIVRAENDNSVQGSGSNQGSGLTHADGAVASLVRYHFAI